VVKPDENSSGLQAIKAKDVADSLARALAESRRHAALVCFLWQSYRDAVDQTVDMFDKLLTRAHTQAPKRARQTTL
jgi:hypothetical protein